MTKRKIAVIYDASYLMGDGGPVKDLILTQRLTIKEKSGVVGSLFAKLTGKGSEKTTEQNAADLFIVSEVVPREVISQVERDPSKKEKGQKAIAALLKEGAAKVDLSLDTVVSEEERGRRPAADPDEMQRQTADKIFRYALRVASTRSAEKYELVVVATEDEDLLQKIAEAGKQQNPILGINRQGLSGSRVLQEGLTAVANQGIAAK
jgi:hypothetical protein